MEGNERSRMVGQSLLQGVFLIFFLSLASISTVMGQMRTSDFVPKNVDTSILALRLAADEPTPKKPHKARKHKRAPTEPWDHPTKPPPKNG